MKAQRTEQQITLPNQILATQNTSKSGPVSKIKTQKDILPTMKTPKRQKSSRFHVSEQVELEKLQNLKGIDT